MDLRYLNYAGQPPQHVLNTGATFDLIVKAPQDFWRQPPDIDIFTAPALYQPMPLHSFSRARVTAKANYKTLYDQGGLFMALPTRTGNPLQRWIKAGIEFYNGVPHFSVVVAGSSADWSLMPMPDNNPVVTVEFERSIRGTDVWSGKESLWVYLVDSEGKRIAVRQVTDVFLDGEIGELWVGAFAGKPGETVEGGTGSQLTVTFSNLEIEQASKNL